MNKKLAVAVVGVPLSLAASLASAEIDVTPVTDYLSGDATTAIAAIGAAALLVHLGIKVWKYLTRAT